MSISGARRGRETSGGGEKIYEKQKVGGYPHTPGATISTNLNLKFNNKKFKKQNPKENQRLNRRRCLTQQPRYSSDLGIGFSVRTTIRGVLPPLLLGESDRYGLPPK